MKKQLYQYVLSVLLLAFVATSAFATQNQQSGLELATLGNIQGTFSFIVLGDNRSS